MNRSIAKLRSVFTAGAAFVALSPLVAFADQTLSNPAKVPDLQTFIADFLKAVVQISLPILTLFIVYSGFLFVFARGNEEKLGKAKQNFMYVILGAILILGAWVLATLIASTANQVLGGS
ncbi:MAG: pilin [Candidatus Pacebacteria bacterium]|nr:pilin [Candidatus Paceibacterota bacterium]